MSLPESMLPRFPVRRGPKPVTGLLVERILGRCLAIFCLVFGAQAIPFVMAQHVLPPWWKAIVLIALYGSFAGIAVVGFIGRDVSILSRFVTIAYLVTLVTWPIAAMKPDQMQAAVPWLWYVCNLVMAAAVFAYPTWIAAVYVVVVPAIFFVVRQTPSGGGGSAEHAILESMYALVLGAAVLTLGSLLRRAAQSVDSAQSAAIHRYGDAVRQHAMEVERVEVDAIVHDGVLTTLLSAAKADTKAAETLAAAMADTSMERLSDSSITRGLGESPIALVTLQERIVKELARLDPHTSVTPPRDIPAMLLPPEVAETLVSAATQALVNSCQHAGDGVSRVVQIRVVEGVAEITIADDGVGYDTSIPSERLGVRVSILERVRNVGGDAIVRSVIGTGTFVTLRWTSESPALSGLRA